MPTKLAADLLHLTEMVGHLGKPQAVLDALEAITWQPTRAHVLGASLLPLNFGTTDSLVCTRARRRDGGRNGCSSPHRALLYLGAAFATARLQKLAHRLPAG